MAIKCILDTIILQGMYMQCCSLPSNLMLVGIYCIVLIALLWMDKVISEFFNRNKHWNYGNLFTCYSSILALNVN